MLAVAILGMMSMAIYRFVASNLTVLRISSEENAVEARYSGFFNLLAAQWQQLPSGVGALTGEPFKFAPQVEGLVRGRKNIRWGCQWPPTSSPR